MDADVDGAAADRQEREQTVASLRATIGLDKHSRASAANEHDRCYISGTISMHEFITGLLAEVRQISPSAMQGDDLVDIKQRADHIAYARASIGLEGFVPSVSAELDALRYIGGEISMQEFVARTTSGGQTGDNDGKSNAGDRR